MTSGPSPSSTSERWDARLWGVLLVVCGALFLDALDVSMVGVALPSISEDLNLPPADLQWVVSSYVLGYGGLLLLGGRLADLLGRRRVFIWAIAVFGLASLAGALTSDATLLVVTRFIKGAAAAFTAPAGLSIITTTFAEGPARNRAVSIYTAFGASGFSLGLVAGGLLTELGWRWTLVFPVPIALAVLLLAPRLIPKDPPAAQRGRVDIAGALAVTAGMLLLVRTVVTAPESGWGSLETVGGFTLAAAILTAFVAIERRTAEPLVRLGILRSSPLVRANLGGMAMFGSYIGFQFIVALYLQTVLGWSALEMALAFLPAGLLVAFGSTRIGGLADRFGTVPLTAIGFSALMTGYALFLRVDDGALDYAALLLPTMLLLGVGFMLSFPSLNIQAMSGVEPHEQGLAAGLVQTSFQVGGAIVLAVVTAIVSSGSNAALDPDSFLDASRPALVLVTGVAAAGFLAVASGLLSVRRPALATEGAA